MWLPSALIVSCCRWMQQRGLCSPLLLSLSRRITRPITGNYLHKRLTRAFQRETTPKNYHPAGADAFSPTASGPLASLGIKSERQKLYKKGLGVREILKQSMSFSTAVHFEECKDFSLMRVVFAKVHVPKKVWLFNPCVRQSKAGLPEVRDSLRTAKCEQAAAIRGVAGGDRPLH